MESSEPSMVEGEEEQGSTALHVEMKRKRKKKRPREAKAMTRWVIRLLTSVKTQRAIGWG